MPGTVIAVSRAPDYGFSKPNFSSITLIAGIGIEGDVHAGTRVKHRYLVARDPTMENLRQVHLVQAETLDELGRFGRVVRPCDLGENITTRGIDLLALPLGTRLRIGASAIVHVTGVRRPCLQIDAFQPGLKGALIENQEGGKPRYKAGIMSVVLTGGEVRGADDIEVALPPEPWRPLPAL